MNTLVWVEMVGQMPGTVLLMCWPYSEVYRNRSGDNDKDLLEAKTLSR